MLITSFIFWLKIILPITSFIFIILIIISLIFDYYNQLEEESRAEEEARLRAEEQAAILRERKERKEIAEKPLGITKEDYETLIKAGYKAWPLYVERYEHNPEMPLKDFVFLYISKLAPEYNTIYKDGTIHCKANSYRSLGDILMVCSVLYPGVTRLEIKQILVDDPDTVGHICPDIQRRVYCHKSIRSSWNLNHVQLPDEFGEKFLDNVEKPAHGIDNIYD